MIQYKRLINECMDNRSNGLETQISKELALSSVIVGKNEHTFENTRILAPGSFRLMFRIHLSSSLSFDEWSPRMTISSFESETDEVLILEGARRLTNVTLASGHRERHTGHFIELAVGEHANGASTSISMQSTHVEWPHSNICQLLPNSQQHTGHVSGFDAETESLSAAFRNAARSRFLRYLLWPNFLAKSR